MVVSLKKVFPLAVAALFLIQVYLVAFAAAQTQTPDYVVMITIDGCRSDKLQEADTPNINNLLPNAAYSWTARTTFPSSTPSAHASLFSGTDTKTHQYYATDNELLVETIFQVFENAGKKTALVDGKGGTRIRGLEVGVTTVVNGIDFRETTGDEGVMTTGLEIIQENKPALIFMLLPMVDYAGHTYGHTSSEYLEAVENADNQVGRLVSKLQELGLYDSTLIVIVSDHGMTVATHGTFSSSDMTIPLIFTGPGVKVGEFSGGKIIDVAPTVANLYGVKVPENSEGTNLFAETQAPLASNTMTIIAVVAIATVMVIVFIKFKSRKPAAEEIKPPPAQPSPQPPAPPAQTF